MLIALIQQLVTTSMMALSSHYVSLSSQKHFLPTSVRRSDGWSSSSRNFPT